MKTKAIGSLLALVLVLGIGYAQAVGGPGAMMSHHGGMMGGAGTAMGPGSATHDHGSTGSSQREIGHERMTQDSDISSGESQGQTGHDHDASSTAGTTGNRKPYQGYGGPAYCP